MTGAWDLTALINAADAKASRVERHLWLVRLMEWLRHEPPARGSAEHPQAGHAGRPPRGNEQSGKATFAHERSGTPLPVLRLKHLLQQLDAHPALREQVAGTVADFWRDIDSAGLLADFGFGARLSLTRELLERLRHRLLPATPDTDDLAALFPLLFDEDDGTWLAAIDDALLARVVELAAPPPPAGRAAVLQAITMLGSAVRDAGYAPLLRRRMDPALLRDEPFRQLARAVDEVCREATDGDTPAARVAANVLRGALDRCLAAADSVSAQLEASGISVDVVYELDQLRARARRIEELLALVLAPQQLPEVRALLAELLRVQRERHGLRALLAQHHSLLARQVAERNAETGEHYIARTRQEYGDMVRRSLGGGAVIAGTTFLKFAIAALGLSAFWGGFAAGVNYAVSFVVVMLLHWTVATKQPAMTAPAMAASLPRPDETGNDEAIEAFVDRVAALTRSQAAAVVGNLAACAPLVLAVQGLAWLLGGAPLVGPQEAAYVLKSLTLIGPTLGYAAFTGVLLFASSLIAGWAENWFVFHRLDSAIAWNPRIVARLGAPRAQRWARWWRAHISGLAANVSLGLLLGLVPALAAFVALPLDVRHVTLATGQLAAAAAALGWEVLGLGAFWWCVAAIPFIGLLNVAVSFAFAFHVALRSRGIRVQERDRLYQAIRQRMRREPLSFVWPPREPAAAAA